MGGPLSTAALMMASKKIKYRYLKWKITGLKSSSTSISVQAAEFRLRLNGADTLFSGSAVCTGNYPSPGGEGPDKLIDQTTNKWNMHESGGVEPYNYEILIDNVTPIEFDGYKYMTANDRDYRDPVTWTLSGSNDNTNWTLLDTQTDVDATIPASRLTWTPVFEL